MNPVYIISKVLSQIIENEIPFNIAIKNNLKDKNLQGDIRKVVSSNVGCVLRHYLIFSEIIKNRFEEISPDSKIAIMVYLANSLFVKKIAEEDIKEFLNAEIKDVEIQVIVDFVKEYEGGKQLIPDSYQPNSLEFLSLRYNTPLWLVKMWKKHYGPHLCIKILRANSKSAENFCRINFSGNKEEILSDENFTEVPEDDFFVNYVGKAPLKENNFLKEAKIFPFKKSLKLVFDKVDLDPLKGIAVYSGFANNYFLELLARNGQNLSFDLVVGSPQAYFEAKKNLNLYKLSKVNLFEESKASIETCLSRKYHTFILSPINSNFSLLRETPDYFLRFKPEMFDELIAKELDLLNQADAFVEDDGEIVYIIPTISYKESHGVVEKFLLGHDEYSLLEEKQFLPCDSYNSSLYFAILRKKIKND